MIVSLQNLHQFLYLASGVENDEAFWLIDVKNCDQNILDDKKIIDCHRKELIGNESAKDILIAINLNIDNLFNQLAKDKYLIKKPALGISFNIPLHVLENIFDFWLEVYKEKVDWEICLGLLKTRKRVSLTNLIKFGGLKGNSMKWAIEIERLHNYKPTSVKNYFPNEPMWQ